MEKAFKEPLTNYQTLFETFLCVYCRWYTVPLWRRHYAWFTDKETEAQRGPSDPKFLTCYYICPDTDWFYFSGYWLTSNWSISSDTIQQMYTEALLCAKTFPGIWLCSEERKGLGPALRYPLGSGTGSTVSYPRESLSFITQAGNPHFKSLFGNCGNDQIFSKITWKLNISLSYPTFLLRDY